MLSDGYQEDGNERSLSLPVERPRGTHRRTVCSTKNPAFSQQPSLALHGKSHQDLTRTLHGKSHQDITRTLLGKSHQTDINYHTKSLTLLFCSTRARGNLTYTHTRIETQQHGTGGYSHTQVDQ